MNLTHDLTPPQKQAVDHFEGPLLVLAGPGSGKTRVITRRIARLVERGVPPHDILAITFTNKAAKEMAERVTHLLPGSRIWVTTFHKFCARVLRRFAPAAGLQPNYTIYDSADQRQLVKRVMSQLDLDTARYSPLSLASQISQWKNKLQSSEQVVLRAEERKTNPFEMMSALVYAGYQKSLLTANAVDFDDLLLHVAVLLAENPGLRAELDARHRFVLVDEYQDTNLAQYQIVRALSVDYPNLCATGDPDQSIYGWRGAEIGNILRFENDFRDSRIVRLEANFRSTKSILKAADSLISHNVHRKEKALTTENPEGSTVELCWFESAEEEAEALALRMREAVESGTRKWQDFAVLYRVNALSKPLEIACLRQRIPYQVAQGTAFFERTEVKDLIGYLRLIHNPHDAAAFLRVVNTPARGIGLTTQKALLAWAAPRQLAPLAAAASADQVAAIGQRGRFALRKFVELMAEFSHAATGSIEGLLRKVIERTSYGRTWHDSTDEDDQERAATVAELLHAAQLYDEELHEDASLEGFLESISLASDVDVVDSTAGKVTLMTLHAAKGLEFPVVFVLGVEQGLLPHERSVKSGDPREIEEERRLLFVGMTRARQELALTFSQRRSVRGTWETSIPSGFLSEMELTQRIYLRSAPGLPPEPVAEPAQPARLSTPRPAMPLRPMPGASPSMARPAFTNGHGTPIDLPFAFTPGMSVRHPQRGRGIVTEVGMSNSRRTVTVEFEDGEVATFVASKAHLQPLGTG